MTLCGHPIVAPGPYRKEKEITCRLCQRLKRDDKVVMRPRPLSPKSKR